MAERFPKGNYYQVLQIDPGAHTEMVRAAYRTLLRVLGRHPDLGGSEAEAATIIEAYKTLSDPERRRAYDQWLAAHAVPSAPLPASRRPPAPSARPPGPVPSLASWIAEVLDDHHLAPRAPFARSFDAVFESDGWLTPRLYVKQYSVITPAQWPTIFVLCRAVGVARHGFMPSTDSVLLVAHEVERLSSFLDQAARQGAAWAWNRCIVAVATSPPTRLYLDHVAVLPRAIRRLAVAADAQSSGERRV